MRRIVDQEFVYVYGSNLLGINGAGTAKHAAEFYGAKHGCPGGPNGRAYGIASKREPYEVLSKEEFRLNCLQFVYYARQNPGTLFYLTEVGCGLSGFSLEETAPYFRKCSPNVLLPGGFKKFIRPDERTVAIVGSRDFKDYGLLKDHLDSMLGNTPGEVQIISGGARGADKFAERYAAERGYEGLIIEPDWDKLGKRAGYLRNESMAGLSTHVVAFWDGKSPGTKAMINISRKFGREVDVQTSQAKMEMKKNPSLF